MSTDSAKHYLDLRGVSCPMNFVKTKLFIDKLGSGAVVEVLLDEGEPVDSVPPSMSAEGHLVVSVDKQIEGHFRVIIRKV
ncbi:MAG: sulfurtransferase TusA family protein [Candidatus Obscuribacterales bacterium]|nr:sulfurtransferase TusA family protein [Candidatus Obscuribacterales bacterium]